MVQQSPVKKNQLPTVVIEVPKQSKQQAMEPNNGSEAACEVTTTACSECELPETWKLSPNRKYVSTWLSVHHIQANQMKFRYITSQRITPQELSHFLTLYAVLTATLQQMQMLLLTYARKKTSRGPRTQNSRSHDLVLPPEANPWQSTKTVA